MKIQQKTKQKKRQNGIPNIHQNAMYVLNESLSFPMLWFSFISYSLFSGIFLRHSGTFQQNAIITITTFSSHLKINRVNGLLPKGNEFFTERSFSSFLLFILFSLFFFFLHTEFRLQKRFKCSHICFPFGSLDVSFCACYSYLVGGSS